MSNMTDWPGMDTLNGYVLRQSDDSAKIDLELIHDECGAHLADAQDGDSLAVLVDTVRVHQYSHPPVRKALPALGIADAVALTEVIRWAQHGSHVRWLTEAGDIMTGTARSIGGTAEAGFPFLAAGEDVRAGYLRITTVHGFELAMPVREAMQRVHETTMAEDK